MRQVKSLRNANPSSVLPTSLEIPKAREGWFSLRENQSVPVSIHFSLVSASTPGSKIRTHRCLSGERTFSLHSVIGGIPLALPTCDSQRVFRGRYGRGIFFLFHLGVVGHVHQVSLSQHRVPSDGSLSALPRAHQSYQRSSPSRRRLSLGRSALLSML